MAQAIPAIFNFVRAALFTASATGTYTAIASIVAGVITAGIALGTARAFGSMLAPDIPGIGPNPGTRIQLAPNTGNKIQVVYGDVLTSGPICDAAISNENQTMHYFTVLSETTDSGTFSLGSQGIRFGDKLLNFGTGATAHQIVSIYDANGTSVTNWAGKIRVRIYAGGTATLNQIFPVPGGLTPAVDATLMMPHWTTTTDYKATDLVFAMIEIDYDAEEGLTNMDAMTFNIVNSLKSPGNVAVDYMTNSRYGAGIANTLIDFNSFTGAGTDTVSGYANETVTYTPNGGGSSTQPRFEINGTLGTVSDVQTNLDKLFSSCGSYLLFDGKQGKYKGLPNKAVDLTDAFVCNDDNIVSKINIQNTDLFQQYNAVEIEYFDKERRDQRNSVLVTTPSVDRNTGEPDNELTYSLDMVNNKVSVEILANIDLNQTRLDKVVTFTGDHSYLQIDTGDVIKFTNETYGFDNKPFRIMRIREIEAADTTLTCEIVGLEYSADVYAIPSVTLDAPSGNVSMPTIPDIGVIPIPGVFDGTWGNITLNQQKFGNVIVNDVMRSFGAGTQLADNPLQDPATHPTQTTISNLIDPESYDITGADIGDYELTAGGQLTGTLSSAYDFSYQGNVLINWANDTTTASKSFSSTLNYNNFPNTTPPPPTALALKVNLDPTAHGFAADMKPQTANVVLRGNATTGITSPVFSNMSYQFLRVTKGEK